MRVHDEERGVDLAVQPKSNLESVTSVAGLAERRPDVIGAAGILRLQREAGNGAVGELIEEQRSPVLDVVGSSGSPLEPAVRTDMESRLGSDFGDVRVHTDASAHDSAKSVGANAYTVGSNVVFQRDAYDPSSTAGRTTIAHELTHVMQQRSDPVDGTPAGGGVSISDPGDRFETAAAENASRVMNGPAPVQAEAAQREVVPTAPVQREAEGEEESLQGSFVQREEVPEEEEEVAG